MADASACTQCGTPLSAYTVEGLCPACLFKQGLGATRGGGGAETAAPAATYATREPALRADAESLDPAQFARLFPQLEVLELLGRGGMGIVYKARQRGLDRLVALKLLPPGVDRDPGFQERFVREARALARLSHPNIVAVHDFGQVEGRYYFLMEFVDGVNLRRMLQAGHLSPLEALGIVPQLCDALQFAHEEGIVHRDVKPENILIDRKGRVKVADFGLAKIVGGGAAGAERDYTLTASRVSLGTPHYMAPEQFERPNTVDHRADIYSLGVVFYEMLTGELPLGRFPPPSRKVQLDVRLDEVVLRTLEKEPQQRYQRAGELKTDLATMAASPERPVMSTTWNAGAPPAPQSARPPEPANDAGPRRLSRAAVLGLLWLAVGTASSLIALFGMYFVREGNLPSGPSLIFLLIAGASTLVAMSTPFGTTLLGISAIGHIRRSGGRRYGLPLALFDALFFPLLLLDLVIVVLIMLMFAPGPGDAAMRAFAIGAILAITTDVFVVRRAWQRVRVPLPPGRIKHPAPSPSPRYEMHPRRPVILYIVLGAVALVIALIVVALALPMVMRRRQAPTSSPAILAPYIAGETASEQPNGEQAYRLAVHGPEGCRASFWLEFLREGKRVDEPGFNLEHWVIPQASLPFDGHVELTLQPGLRGYSAVWRIEGNAGTMSSTEAIDWPLRDMAVRDTTWGQSTGAWAQAVIGQPLPLFVLRGGREMLLGQPGEIQADHPPDVAVRLMARFDPVSADEARHGPRFGKSPARHADDALPTVPTPEFSPPAADPLRPPMGVPGSGSPKQTPDDPRLGAPGYRYRPGSRQPVAVPTPALPAPGAEGSGDRTREVDPQPRALPPSGPEPDTGREPAQPEAAPTAPLAPTPQASPPGAPSGARR